MVSAVDSFQFDENRDLSGYVDGTENPDGEDAVNAAILEIDTPGLAGSSFVAVQQWLHDFEALDAMSTEAKDDAIGRHIADNEEYEAPTSAHAKRSAQEDFDPEAFEDDEDLVRRAAPEARRQHHDEADEDEQDREDQEGDEGVGAVAFLGEERQGVR